MIKIAVCDDNILITQKIEFYIHNLCKNYGENFDVQVFYSGEQLYKSLYQNEYFDIIYLDIEMYELSGISIGRQLRGELKNESTLLIYVSSFDNYFIELFEVQPFRFLHKPFYQNEFNRIFNYAYQHIFKRNTCFEFKTGQTIIKQPIKNILYFESRNREINVVTINNIYTYYDKLQNIVDKLAQQDFIWVHKSYYVNFDHVQVLNYTFVILSNGHKINISEQRRSFVRNEYMKLKGKNQNENV
ncbi:LytTR family DNA-binding domain-containing protein [Oscillospiraceae bacterium PP1C4]